MTARVVSLVPSVTETLMAWGVVPLAVTRFCEQPGLPTVGGTKNPDIDVIVGLQPDLVVVDREENRREDADALAAAGIGLHVTDVRAVAEVSPTLAGLRAAVGLATAADDPGNGVAGWVGPVRARPLRAWVPIWRRPWMTINSGTYGSSMLEACGAVNVFADHPDAYPQVTIEDVIAARPDVVLAPTEPYPSARHEKHFADVAPMVIVDGKDLFWWGVRTPGAMRRLRQHIGGLATAD